MPGRDRSGPMGMGPLTGRGLGPCGTGAGYGAGYGRGFGRGNGRFGAGRGRGMGFGGGFAGRGWGYPVDAAYPAYPAEDEKDFLDREIDCLKSELDALEKRRGSLKDQD